jgi:hypothetical protein
MCHWEYFRIEIRLIVGGVGAVEAVEAVGNNVCCALAMVLWYHTRLISERSPVRFPAGCKKTFPVPSSAVTSPTDVIVWRLVPSTLLENPHSTEQHRRGQHCTKKRQHASPTHVEDNGATTTVYRRGEDRGHQVKVLSLRDISNSNMHFLKKKKKKKHSTRGSSLTVTTNEIIFRQIKTGYCLK